MEPQSLASEIISTALGAFLAAWFMLWIILGILSLCLRFVTRDPQRLFTAQQKRYLMLQANGRCEHRWFLLLRCAQNQRLQADHVMPWSRGGRTTLANGQMLCPRHNRRKTNRLPGPLFLLVRRHRLRNVTHPTMTQRIPIRADRDS